MGTKSLYMSVASVSEPHHDCRVTPGTPPIPFVPPYTKLWIGGSSCELMSWPLNATGNIAPTINIQGDTTQLNPPGLPDNGLSSGLDIDLQGNQYIWGIWSSPGNNIYAINRFSPGQNGNVAPSARIILGNSAFATPNVEVAQNGLCVDDHGNCYAGVGHWIFKFPTNTPSGTITATVFQTANARWPKLDVFGIQCMYYDIVRQVIWTVYNRDNATNTTPEVVGYNLDGSVYATVTGFVQPMSVAVGPDGSLYVTDVAESPASTFGIIYVFTPPNFNTPRRTLYDSAGLWAYFFPSVAVDQNGIIYLSIGNSDSPPRGVIYSYPASSNGDTNGTALTTISGSNTYLTQMIENNAQTYPAAIRLSA